jgi:hypothetical protein
MTDHDTPTPWPDNPWVLYSVDGHTTPCVDRDDWLTEWRRRIGDIETAPLTLLWQNEATFQAKSMA